MENLLYLIHFNEFSIFLGLVTPILAYLDPKMAVKSHNTTQGDAVKLHSIVLYRLKSDWGYLDGEFALFSDLKKNQYFGDFLYPF